MVELPEGVRPITHIFREAGYYTVIKAKTDFNFKADKLADSNDWKDRKTGQPFFAQVSFIEPHRRGQVKSATVVSAKDFDAFKYARDLPYPTDPAKVVLPPFYPDDPAVRRDYAGYLDAVRLLDQKVGALLKRLDDEGLAANTLVFFIGDNGICMPRGKQFLYEAGIHVPLIVRWPGAIEAGRVEERLVSGIDLAATSLAAAGIARPAKMEGMSFAGPSADPPRKYIIAARDRCDETVDRIRSVRNDRYKYIRNFMPELPWTQKNNYKDTSYATLAVLREWKQAGKLSPEQALFMADHRPAEELYDLKSDPNELKNLADAKDDAAQAALKELRGELERWIKATGDQGQFAEKAENVRK